MPKILEDAKNILRQREDKKNIFWMLHKILKIICFSTNFPINTTSPLVFKSVVVHVQVCFKPFFRQELRLIQ